MLHAVFPVDLRHKPLAAAHRTRHPHGTIRDWRIGAPQRDAFGAHQTRRVERVRTHVPGRPRLSFRLRTDMQLTLQVFAKRDIGLVVGGPNTAADIVAP